MRAARTCEELTRTTEALLALARNQCSTDETVELGEVVQRACSRLQEEDNARLQIQSEDDALVRGDEALLVLAATNLIDNALKYTAGPIQVRVRVSGASCTLAITDCGEGIAEQDMARVRQPFVRGKAPPAGVRGTGLGLALVDHVVTVHHGTLQLTNLLPHGLSAEIRLPIWQPRDLIHDTSTPG